MVRVLRSVLVVAGHTPCGSAAAQTVAVSLSVLM
jgi:hypothetical protein